jgi:hypothetical protein
MNLYFIKIFNFEINLFIKKVLAKPLLVFIPLTITSYAVLQMANVDTWLLFGLFGLTYAVIFFSLTYFLLMNNYERSFIKTIFK